MIFISKYRGYKQWIIPARYSHDQLGQRVYHAGKFVKFTDGRLDTNDPEEIEALMKNPVYGIDYWAVDADNNVVKKENEFTKAELARENQANATTGATGCPKCDFKAVSQFGLQAHIRAKHKS